ncbi:hypothetical protein SBRCBS47491_010042 [Sporothrix bragantina]|uniref:Beta-mannosidase B n=1 Tax=Sporothrix bragantina TaxID=671064 RepID=A0ABP0CZP0_9PEZI
MARSRTDLTAWQWRLVDTNGHAEAETVAAASPSLKEWTAVSSFPSVVQMELQKAGLLPDVNIGENERKTQWPGFADWAYQTTFQKPSAKGEVDLVFDGLDTFASVTLNGKILFSSDNMFVPERVPVTSLLQDENTLHILFESAPKRGAALEAEHGVRKALFRDARRNHIRKAQYHWGWDWGPVVVTTGPYLPVYLDVYDTARIDDVYVATTKLSEDHTSAVVDVAVSVVSLDENAELAANVRLVGPSGNEVASSSVSLKGTSTATASFNVNQPQLWWPNGQGEQHLYTVEVTLPNHDFKSVKTGIRTITVAQEPLAEHPGTSFTFVVNGRPVFAQGGNWIPADTLLPTVTRERYYEWVQNARDVHMNLLRVWGGGIYESNDFFDACDELGLLVWHDYGFACTNLPVYPGFLESVKREAEVQTRRLRSRASLALLCGGNEDFMLLDWTKEELYDHADTKGPFPADKPFPQRAIYLDILPKVAAKIAPTTFYWANSPWSAPDADGKGAEANDLTRGDVHQWSVWHGEQRPYQDYGAIHGRFVSEFGMHGFPVTRTLDYFAPPGGKGRHAQSRLIDCHNKGHGAHTRIARYLAENFRYDTTSLRNFAYGSQLMQAEAYGYALRDWKRLYGGPLAKARCSGAVIWQLNDDYPCTSWSLVDYFVRPKPAWYTVKRAFSPISVASQRTPMTRFVDEDAPAVANQPPSFAIFAHNTAPEEKTFTLVLQAYDFETGKWTSLPPSESKRSVTLPPGQNTELGTLAAQPSWTEDSLVILEVTLQDDAGKTVARFVDWPEPYRYLEWPHDTSLDIQTRHNDNGGAQVTIQANQPLKGVWLEPKYTEADATAADAEPRWEDNLIDLMPGQAITVSVTGLKGRDVGARFLADWEVNK